ncbi:MAG: hypothetical protein KDD51_10430 [Bdellovibrionales bacterium]|nr:hypothetical protein [Bdellovibrionales bacterium]
MEHLLHRKGAHEVFSMGMHSRKAAPLFIGALVLFAATGTAGEKERQTCGSASQAIAGSGIPSSTGSAGPMTIAKTPADIAKEQQQLLDGIRRRHRDSHPYAMGERDFYRDHMLKLLVERGIIRSAADVPTDKTDAELMEWLSANYARERFAQSVERDVQRRLKDLQRAGVATDGNEPPKDPAELTQWVNTQYQKAIKEKKLDPEKSPALLEELGKQYQRYTSHPQKFSSPEELAEAASNVLSRSSSLMTAALRASSWQLGRPIFEQAVFENPDYQWARQHVDALRRDEAYVRNNTGIRTPLWEWVDPEATFPQRDIRRGAMGDLTAAVTRRVTDETGYDPSFVRFIMSRFEVSDGGGGRISPLLDTADNGSLGFLAGNGR